MAESVITIHAARSSHTADETGSCKMQGGSYVSISIGHVEQQSSCQAQADYYTNCNNGRGGGLGILFPYMRTKA